MNLYPLKLSTFALPKVWGEEIWHVAQMGERVSVVENGYLADNDINDLLEVYMGELVGEHVYEQYGTIFPVLLKVINTVDDLSIQVHPDNEIALEHHQCLGKSEMWYIMDAAEDATLISGFNKDTDKEEILSAIESEHLLDLLNVVKVNKGDVVGLPAGRVHALRKHLKVAEVQQNSDITYRLFDYNRQPRNGVARPLHIQQALNVLDFQQLDHPLIDYTPKQNGAVNLSQSDHFVTNLLTFDRDIIRDYAALDSFVVYMCVEGSCRVIAEGEAVNMNEGDTVLIPASLDEVQLIPINNTNARLLEVYMS